MLNCHKIFYAGMHPKGTSSFLSGRIPIEDDGNEGKATYTGDSKRPDSFDVSYTINGEKAMPVNIPNSSD